jgi:hypothetical protein
MFKTIVNIPRDSLTIAANECMDNRRLGREFRSAAADAGIIVIDANLAVAIKTNIIASGIPGLIEAAAVAPEIYLYCASNPTCLEIGIGILEQFNPGPPETSMGQAINLGSRAGKLIGNRLGY